MAKQTKLTVTSPLGTFTRTTVRTYSHLVVVKGERFELLEARRLRNIAYSQKMAADYRATHTRGFDPKDASDFSREHTAERIADGSYLTWAEELDTEIAALVARGPYTEDTGDTWLALGWCGRLDLARKLAVTEQASTYRHVAIVDVATGAVVR